MSDVGPEIYISLSLEIFSLSNFSVSLSLLLPLSDMTLFKNIYLKVSATIEVNLKLLL